MDTVDVKPSQDKCLLGHTVAHRRFSTLELPQNKAHVPRHSSLAGSGGGVCEFPHREGGWLPVLFVVPCDKCPLLETGRASIFREKTTHDKFLKLV